jgi:ATP-dependent protease ClpP protease subunit
MKNKINKGKKVVRPRKFSNGESKPVSHKSVTDNAITLLSLQLEYLFDYGVNFKDRIITLTEVIEYPMFDILDGAMSIMEAESKKAITIRIKSVGGDVYSTLALVGRLKSSKCKIITEGYGEVMSAAVLVLACGEKRRISKYAFFMHHEASYEVEGRHSANKNTVAQMEKEEKQWAKWMASFSKKDEKFWLTKGITFDAYFTPEELLKMGVVDEII